jgi:glycosyltransferase involved in cell wall biosynthesis
MTRGGIETWLMHVLRHIDRQQFQMDFLVHVDYPCAYDDEIRALGSRIIPCPYTTQPLQYARHFKQILHQFGPYDIVHSHVNHFNGYVLYLARQFGVPVRVAHSHNDSTSVDAQASWQRRLYFAFMKWEIKQCSTVEIGCSKQAATHLFGLSWKATSNQQILHYGVDLTPFQKPISSVAIRSELGIPTSAFVVGHVGRFAAQKNHAFLLKVAQDIIQREPNAFFVLVGEGPLKSEVEQQVFQMGLSDRVLFTGSRSDIPQLMRGAVDVFLFPSLYEGLPLVLIEAQAAGLPCVISDVISEEVDAIKPLIHRLSLSHVSSIWAKAVLAQQHVSPLISQLQALEMLTASRFRIQDSAKQLENIYIDQCCQRSLVAL